MSGDPVAYLENSFLSPLISQEGVTDISYNGESIYYVSNLKGRQKAGIEIKKEEVSSFLRPMERAITGYAYNRSLNQQMEPSHSIT